MKGTHYVTIAGTAIATYALPMLGFVPAAYKPLVAAGVAAASALWHLWMLSPWA